MSSSLSQELWDRVIDEMHSDAATLVACSLVCSMWQPRSQRHLFDSVVLFDVASVDAFKELIERSSTIATYVQRLCIQDYLRPALKWAESRTSNLREILLKLINVQSLKLHYLGVEAILHSGIASDTLPIMTRLHIRGLRCADPATLASILLLMPRVEELSLTTLQFGSLERLWHPDIPVIERVFSRLRTLHLNLVTVNPPLTNQYGTLGQKIGLLFTRLDYVTTVICTGNDVTALGGLTASLGSSLRRLGLHSLWASDRDYSSLPKAVSQNLDLSHNVNLQDLSLSDYQLLRKQLDWRSIVLEQIASSALYTIQLSFMVDCSETSSFIAVPAGTEDIKPPIDAFAWTTLDRRVSQLRNFRKLTIIVKLYRGFDPPSPDDDFEGVATMWISTVRQRLPLASERGVLTVVTSLFSG